MVLLDEVSKSFPAGTKKGNRNEAIHKISLHIPKGMTVGIIGPSGAGKTTLLKLICGLLMPEEGRVRIEERALNKRGQSKISFLPAERNLLAPEETLSGHIELMRSVYRMEKQQAAARADFLIEHLGLKSCLNEPMRNLSLGFCRRAETAAAFFKPAKLFVLDEPCIGMDETAKDGFQKIVQEYRVRGGTILLSSHNMGEIEALSQRILLLDKGKEIFYGDKEALYQQLAPMREMELTFAGGLPDMGDLPFWDYEQENQRMQLRYNSWHITAAELIENFLQSTEIREITMKSPDLEDIITQLARRKKVE